MKPRDLTRYLEDLGWRDPLDLPVERQRSETSNETPPSAVGSAPESGDLAGLARLLEGCTRCRLSEQRRSVVVGEGAADARVMFVGEGPGAEEDRTGRPFVGQAGKLLDRMILAMGFDRSQTYIANVVKCRPPGNRDPEPDEIATCRPFLERQIRSIRPVVICTLGRVAAQAVLSTGKPLRELRGTVIEYGDAVLVPTYHPAYLLRYPEYKRDCWEDMKLVLRLLHERR